LSYQSHFILFKKLNKQNRSRSIFFWAGENYLVISPELKASFELFWETLMQRLFIVPVVGKTAGAIKVTSF
jgi:hypothetical protein